MADDIMNIERRQKTWQGFLHLMTWSGAAAMITLGIMWWALV